MVASIILPVIAVGLFYGVGLIIYRLVFHPLARFPGPKLPACSLWYEFYYDAVLRGQLMWQIQKWHQQYGPIIRINPHELHILDSDYYDEIMGSQTRRRHKSDWWVKSGGFPGSSFATVSHEHHRLRRSALNPFFSKKAVTKLESLIRDKVAVLISRFERAAKTGEIIPLDVAFTALTMDIICRYTFGADDNYLLEEDFKLSWKTCLREGFESGGLTRQFPWMINVMKNLPDSIVGWMSPPVLEMIVWRRGIEQRARATIDSEYSLLESSNRSIFQELKEGDLPPEEKELERMCDESQVLIGAGSETTAQTLAYLCFHLLKNPQKLQRVREELKSVLPNPTDIISHTTIENLPYVNAVVSEGLRTSWGITTRLPRIAPDEALRYQNWTIPKGTPVSSTPYFVLTDPNHFPEPEKFLPERWLPENTAHPGQVPLVRYLVNFGKGSRQCIGQSLAYAEIYLALSAVFRRFELELYETTSDAVKCDHDAFVAAPPPETKGIRVRVVGQINE